MQRKFGLAMVAGILVVAFGCAKNGESNDLAAAQRCLNNVPQNNPSQAQSCMAGIAKYDDQQADILKCGITITAGGLTEDKLVAAYNIYANKGQTNQSASFMAALSLDNPDVTTGYATAKQANQYCLASGETGLIYISDLILTGTYMNLTIQTLTGSGIDVNDPASVNTAVSNLLTTCGGASPPASCTQDIGTIGTVATNLGSTYCATSGADQTVCGQIQSAVDSGAGNSANVGQALYCYLQKKTYDAGTNSCQ